MSWKTNKGENLLRNKTKQIKQIMQVQKLPMLPFCDGYIQNESIPGQKTLSTLFRRTWIKKMKTSVLFRCEILGFCRNVEKTNRRTDVQTDSFIEMEGRI